MNIYLTPLTVKYINSYLKWFNNPVVSRYLYEETPHTPSTIKQWLESIELNHFATYYALLIKNKNFVNSDNTVKTELNTKQSKQEKSIIIEKGDYSKILEHIGHVGIMINSSYAEISVVVGCISYQNKRIATSSIKYLLTNEIPNIRPVIAEIHKNNIPSINLFKSLGFCKQEHIGPKHDSYIVYALDK